MSRHFSDRTRSAVDLAAQEARELGHPVIGDGHLLLGLLHARHGVAARVLKRQGVELRPSRAALGTVRLTQARDKDAQLSFELSAKRALQRALHEAFERNDGPIRASYLLLGTIGLDGVAANLVRAQGGSPAELVEAARRELPGTDRQRGLQLLDERLATLDAFLRAARRGEDLARIVSSAPDRDAATRDIAALLDVSELQAAGVAGMPLDMTTSEGVEALEAERRDLEQRLTALRGS